MNMHDVFQFAKEHVVSAATIVVVYSTIVAMVVVTVVNSFRKVK